MLPHDLIWVGHYFSHFGASPDECRAFARALRKAPIGTGECDVGSDIELDDPYYLHHWTFTLVKASPAALRRLDAVARDVASRHGVQYDGWIVDGADFGTRLIIPNVPEFRLPWAGGSGNE